MNNNIKMGLTRTSSFGKTRASDIKLLKQNGVDEENIISLEFSGRECRTEMEEIIKMLPSNIILFIISFDRLTRDGYDAFLYLISLLWSKNITVIMLEKEDGDSEKITKDNIHLFKDEIENRATSNDYLRSQKTKRGLKLMNIKKTATGRPPCKKDAVDQIIELHKQGWSNVKIAEKINVNRNTVNKYVNLYKAGNIN